MTTEIDKTTVRILVVDDNRGIHEDFNTIFSHKSKEYNKELDDLDELLEHILDESGIEIYSSLDIVVDSAYQGREALEMVEQAYNKKDPYTVVFMDIRMPPGWNGIETVRQIFRKYPETEIVILTAYSDFSLEEINHSIGQPHNLLYLKKPFDRAEIRQIVFSIAGKTNMIKQFKDKILNLELKLEHLKNG